MLAIFTGLRGRFSSGRYNAENRLTWQLSGVWPSPGNNYAYDPWGKRVLSGWNPDPEDGTDTGSQPNYNFSFYAITGQKIATLICSGTYPAFPSCQISQNVYYGKKLIVSGGVTVVTDRLGNVRANSQGESFAYYPYGEERTSTVDSREKFGTYFRDWPGQDYADQRYYNSRAGSFFTVDPGGIKTANSGNPLSWNRYAYVEGDPVDFMDRHGLAEQVAGDGNCDPDLLDCGPPECYEPWNEFVGQPDPGCPTGGGGGPSDPAPTSAPPQLKCKFDGAQNLGPTNSATALSGPLSGQTVAGYYMQMLFSFSASGGSGEYSWSYSQSVVTVGTLTTTTGSYGVHSYNPKDTLAPKAHGATYNIGDAPGETSSNQSLGSIISAHVNWFLHLQVSVTDTATGQTVDCPTVYWTVTETWATVNGTLQQSGSASVTRVIQQ